MARLSNKVAIVTGGSMGLGRSISLALAREGAHVAIWDIDTDSAHQVAEEIKKLGRKALVLKVDVSDAADVKSMTDRVFKEFKRIDILVNNAGICQVASIDEITEEDWDRVMDVNLKGVFLCSRAVMQIMKNQRAGKIINMGSIAGKLGGIATGAHYSASKAAVMCLTKSLARELAPFGINVNAVSPGVIKTRMTFEITKGNWEDYIRIIPLGHIGSPEDIASAILFLASDEANYITGEILDVNGGMLMD